ncbi:S8 family serine peptidase [Actinomadura namibiensis]|uniref:Type VII secretion-associated serine protease mycosin n=1 Tax=Actinomadura namibiensis TaxID=182080 RepID=A0A7W3LIT4_ACTNM|nr:S8 family serine peptidase [Actinomadura namibiensis]MBA8948834.1 type VII secretion-associated serine protease mycosin [Actinomadura namibiensis]
MAVLMRGASLVGAVALGAAAVLVPVGSAGADEVRDRQRPMLRTLELENAWKTTRGEGVTVAVVDSGVDARQADLKGVVTTGPNMLSAIDGSATPTRQHGTGMASLIAGRGHGPGGRNGVIGVAPGSRVLSIRAIAEPEDASYRLYRSSGRAENAVARGIRYAVDHGADVINLSLGKYRANPEEREAIAYAIGKGVVVVAAAGNDGDNERRRDDKGFTPFSYPAGYPGVVAVAATRPSHGHAPFSNRNYSVLVAAPGDRVVTAGPGGQYFLGSGTSQASAVVAGVAALIRARHRRLPPPLVAQALIAGSRYGPSGGYDPEVGFGEVNAVRALAAADSLTAPGRRAAGKATGQRFGTAAPEPVEVIDHPFWVRPVIGVVVVGGVAGTAGAVLVTVLLARRNPRSPEPPRRETPVGPHPW